MGTFIMLLRWHVACSIGHDRAAPREHFEPLSNIR